MLEEVCARMRHMERAKASAHMDASAQQHGVDMCGFRQQLAWLSMKEMTKQEL